MNVRIATYGVLLFLAQVFGALGTYSPLGFAVLASSSVFVLALAGKVASSRFTAADRFFALAVLILSPALAALALSRFGSEGG